jgi:hypothetical protein
LLLILRDAPWVRANFAKELRALRSHGPERVGLLVVIDGDLVGVIARKKQLEDEGQKAGLKERTDDERVAICVPTRNLETWVTAFCRGGTVTETDDYSRGVTYDEVRKAASLWLSKADACDLPSYRDAREELARLGP